VFQKAILVENTKIIILSNNQIIPPGGAHRELQAVGNRPAMEIEMAKIIDRNCHSGQSVFDVIDELKNENLIPERSILGDRATLTGEQPENAVARITVRRNEMFWVITY
jgi:hypothetical protein